MASKTQLEDSLVAVIKALEYVERALALQPPPILTEGVEGEASYFTLLRELNQYLEQAKRELR
ncbi:MAG: hypothetical protein O7F10_02960 [Deltaproteobacteria bacterium]|nr:hypothetical protein [Deltaproteobacteria bacterium]